MVTWFQEDEIYRDRLLPGLAGGKLQCRSVYLLPLLSYLLINMPFCLLTLTFYYFSYLQSTMCEWWFLF